MSGRVFLRDEAPSNTHGFYEVGSDRFFRDFHPIQDIVAELHPLVIQDELLKTETLISPNQALAADCLDSRQEAENRAGSDIRRARQKAAGFCELFPQVCERGKVVEVVDTLGEEDDPMRKCFALLERRKSISGIYVRTGNCLPICRAMSVLGLVGKVVLITTDLFVGG